MSEHAGEKTEQATPRRLEEAAKRGQFARSAEVQTVFVLIAGLMMLKLFGWPMWRNMILAQTSIFGHLHEIPITLDALPHYCVQSVLLLAGCLLPVLIGAAVGGLLAGAVQNRFQTASEALTPNWERLNPVEGFKRVFSLKSLAPAGIAILKLLLVIAICFSKIKAILNDATLYSGVGVAGLARFLADSGLSVIWRVILSLVVLAALDYTYQFWQTNRDLMMTRDEVKEEAKNSEGNPHVKARQRRRRATTVRQMLLEIPKADVVVTNPTHLAVALRYDRKSMKAPKIVAKGSRFNALRIREIASANGVPIVENKPLARMMFKHARVGGEVPAQLYLAVAEVLAYVYRTHRYRFYSLGNQAALLQSDAKKVET